MGRRTGSYRHRRKNAVATAWRDREQAAFLARDAGTDGVW